MAVPWFMSIKFAESRSFWLWLLYGIFHCVQQLCTMQWAAWQDHGLPTRGSFAVRNSCCLMIVEGYQFSWDKEIVSFLPRGKWRCLLKTIKVLCFLRDFTFSLCSSSLLWMWVSFTYAYIIYRWIADETELRKNEDFYWTRTIVDK